MSEMKPCFGRELAVRFGPGTTPIGVDPEASRLECHGCPDLERCAVIVGLVVEMRKRN